VREEADEAARAAETEPADRLAEEAADVLYHLAVLLRSRDVRMGEVLEVLNGRRR
jgi:phosphoribosyl-AMP cyclohydrolase / phosphoribosyl-ATP pyrophosphohydrolase